MSTARSSARRTGRSGKTARTGRSTGRTARTNASESAPETPAPVDIFAKWRDGAPEAGPERALFIIKPDVLDDHEDDIVGAVEDLAEDSGYEIEECSRIQLTKDKAVAYYLAVQESRADEIRREAEEARLAAEEAARIAAEEEEARREALGSARSRASGKSGASSQRSPRTARSSKAPTTARSSLAPSTARSSVASGDEPRTSRSVRRRRRREAEEARLRAEEEERLRVERERDAGFLCSGEILVIILQGAGAVAAMRELVGPEDPDQWEEFPDTIRGRFASDLLRNAVGTSLSTAGGRREAEYFGEIFKERAMMDALLKSGRSKPAKKSHWVNMADLLNFCFPIHDRHPASTGRLSVFGNYGPLAEDGTLRGGRTGGRVVSHMELRAMIEEMQREDILKVYIGNLKLQREEQEEILKQADEELKKMKQLTPEDITGMFVRLPTNDRGQYSFHDMQRVILKERERRVKQLCLMPCDRGNERLMLFLKRALRKQKELQARGGVPATRKKKWKARPPRPQPKIADQDTYRINAIMLNKNTFRITEVNNGNSSSLTTNVKLLLANRDKQQDSSSDRNWDSTCCLRRQNRGSYVDLKQGYRK